MRFLVDNQLPIQLARFLLGRGHDAVHVAEVGLDEASDKEVWELATREGRVVVSKDEDFFFLAHRPEDQGALLWIRLGNCRKAALVEAFEGALDKVVAAFESGQRVVELR